MMIFEENGQANGVTNGGLTEATERSYRAFVDGAFAVQEQYAKLMLGWMAYDPVSRTFAEGAGTNRRAVETLAEHSLKQWEASQALAGEMFRAYASLFQVPGARPGVRATPYSLNGGEPNGEEPGLPIEDYDRLSVEEIGRRLSELNALEVEEIKAYEKRNKNRGALLERLDRSLI